MNYLGGVGLTACQVRMARAALRWSVEELARRSDVSEKTIRRIEKVYGYPPNITTDTLHKLRSCFEAQGMTLIADDGSPEGPGVRFGKYPGRTVRPNAFSDGATTNGVDGELASTAAGRED